MTHPYQPLEGEGRGGDDKAMYTPHLYPLPQGEDRSTATSGSAPWGSLVHRHLWHLIRIFKTLNGLPL
jgi:hypothetical protein